jgi:hypothetical protein
MFKLNTLFSLEFRNLTPFMTKQGYQLTTKRSPSFDGKCLLGAYISIFFEIRGILPFTPVWKCVHVSENKIIVSKFAFYLVINIVENIGYFILFLYWIGNVSRHHISTCIMLCHQHKSHYTYVLCKQRWIIIDYMNKKLPCF